MEAERGNVQISGTEMRDTVIGKGEEICHVTDVLTAPKPGGVVPATGNGGAGTLTSCIGTTEDPLGDRGAHGKKIVGDYMVLSSLGAGSFSVVYLAKHRRTGQTVAIKSIKKEKLVAKKLVENLEGEIKITRGFHHKNIVELYDVIKTERSFHLVLEHCGGGDLHRFLKKHERLSEATTRHFMCQLATGLLFLRANGLIHRDLKPQNLLLSSDSLDATLKIADFGFARILTEAAMTDTLCGSPQYMAPEIMQGRRYDAKADLWSVGMILYECVVGKTPFRGRSQMELLRNIMARPLTIPSSLDISPGCKSIMKMLLKAGPELRCSYDEFFSHKWVGLEQTLYQQQEIRKLGSLSEEEMRKGTVMRGQQTKPRKYSDVVDPHETKGLIHYNSAPHLISNKPSLAYPKFNTASPLVQHLSGGNGDTSSLLQQSGLALGKHTHSSERDHSSISSSSNNSSEYKSPLFTIDGAVVNSPPTPLLLRVSGNKNTCSGRRLSTPHYEFKPLMPSPPKAQMNEIVVPNMVPPLNLDASVQGTDDCNDGVHHMQGALYSGIEDYVIVDEYLGISPQANAAKSTKLQQQQSQGGNTHQCMKAKTATVASSRVVQNQLPMVSGVGLSPKGGGGTTGSGGSYHSSPQQLAVSVVSDLGNVETVGKRAVVLAQLGDASVVAALEVMHAGYISQHIESALLNRVYCSLKEHDVDTQVPGLHCCSSNSEVSKDSNDGILPNYFDTCFGLDFYDPITRNARFEFKLNDKENQSPVFTTLPAGRKTTGPEKSFCAAYGHSDNVSQAPIKLLADAFVLYLKSLEMLKAMVLLVRQSLEALEVGKGLLLSQIDWSHHEQVTSWGEGLLHWLSLQFTAVLDRAEQCQSKLRSHVGEHSSSAITCSMKSVDHLIIRGAMYMGEEAILMDALGQCKKATKQLSKACLLLETLTFGGSSSSEALASSRGGNNREKGGFYTLARELIRTFHERSSKKSNITVGPYPTAG